MTTVYSEWGAASAARDGESVSGDRYVLAEGSFGLVVAGVDGVGHGPYAAEIAAATITLIDEAPELAPREQLWRCHRALQGTRGAALLLARYDARQSRLEWTGVGPMHGVVVRAHAARRPRREPLLVRQGLVGHSVSHAVESSTPIEAGDILIIASDGVRDAFVDDLSRTESPDRMAHRILLRHRRPHDDAMAVVVRFRGDS